jgi:hypothetical protein
MTFKVSSLSTLFFLVSCVTINVYFPASAAEKAAEKIVEEVIGQTQQDDDVQDKEENENEAEKTSLFEKAFNILIPTAQAKGNINISNPIIMALRKSLKQRHKKLASYYDKGALGYTNNALISIRSIKIIPLKSRNEIKQLVSDANKDRLALYREIANANGHPEWAKDIRKTFAKVWINKALSGWWYQNEKNKWIRK